MKKCCAAVLLAVLLALCASALAWEITPYADDVFGKAAVTLSADKEATFTARTSNGEQISVISCTLQKKSGASWTYAKTLTPPDFVGGQSYSAVSDYSGSIPSGGPYRVKAIFDADGHTRAAYSNERSF